MKKILCDQKQTNIGIIFFAVFLILITGLTIFGVSPMLHSIFQASIFTTLLAGATVAIQSIYKVGVKNFVGKSMLYFLVAIVLSMIDIVHSITKSDIGFDQYIWILVSICMISGLSFLMTSYKLKFPKNLLLESALVFFSAFFILSLFTSWPQLLNSLLITTAIMSLRISGKKTHCGIVYISIGLIFLCIGNILFISRYWNSIAFFGDISDIVFLTSWFSIITGLYFTKKRYV